MVDIGWHRTFDDPIPVLDGRVLRTFLDAGRATIDDLVAQMDERGLIEDHPTA
jgi:hypothetical protein